MTKRKTFLMLTSVSLAAASTACETAKNQSIQKVDLPPGSVGHIDTQTTRVLQYTLREDNLAAYVDTPFWVQLGNGEVRLPLSPFYGPTLDGEVGVWQVDGAGRAAKIPGSSTPGFISRLESMPNGLISIGQEWEIVTPSDAEAMSSSSIVMQLKRRLRIADAFSTSSGTAVRVELDGWSRFVQNPTLTGFLADSGITLPADWTPQIDGVIDVDLASGTLLGMKFYEDLLSDATSTEELNGTVGSSTYCIDTSTGLIAAPDICGWNQ